MDAPPRTAPRSRGTRRATRPLVIYRKLPLLLLPVLLACGLLAAGSLAQTPSPATPAPEGAPSAADPMLWPEPQRAFFQDGPGLLMPAEQRRQLAAGDEAARERAIREFLGRDPLPATKVNELREGIDRRRRLADADYLSPLDVRAQIIFLNGKPD